MIHNPSEFQSDFEVETDVAIIGSGPAGSAAAYKLTSRGHRVIILEAGGYFNTGDFSRNGIKALKNLYQEAGQVYTTGNAYFATMFGKGVGGGSLVNSGISFRPPEKALHSWADSGGLIEFTPEKIKPFVDEVEQHVRIEIQEISKLGRNNTIFKDGLEKLGFKGGVIPRNVRSCQACGICFFGCPSGAKQSMDKNFIAEAVQAGAEVYIHSPVVRIDTNEKTGEIEAIYARILDPDSGKVKCHVTVKAKHFILAAGAIGTPRILQQQSLANSSGQVGKNFRCHPSAGVIGIFNEEIRGFNSVMQGYYSDHFFDEDILLETYWGPIGALAISLPGFGNETLRTMKDIGRFAGAGAMIRDESSGTVSFDGDRTEVSYNVNLRDQKLLTKGLFHSAEVLLAAGAHTIYADSPHKTTFHSLGELRDYFSGMENLGPDIIREGNHGMGTCRMGENPKTSVVNSYGRSHDISNLWILDISTFPAALGVNPQITVMALALRGAEYLHDHFS